ncbi:MAG: DUF1800 domain-containing protein [Pirellulaceae bacterium]
MIASRQQQVSSEPPVAGSSTSPVLALDPQWAWAEYQPDAQRPWDLARAGHLYRRATFGASWPQLQQAVAEGPQTTIERLVRPAADVQTLEATMDQDEDAVARASGIESLRAWWLRRLIMTGFPLREKMTVFWHSHFGVSNARVNDGQLMMRHVRTLRNHALGSYRALLDGVSQDPAVFLALGADANRKSTPNERFSRQLMERFSLGPGHYGEEDVREAARAFTGWFVLRGRLRYLAHEYDAGPKRVLGQEGQWQPGDIVRIVLEQPDTPRLVARKLFRWLISEVDDPSDELIQPMAEMLGQQYDVGRVVETMLRSNVFFSEHALHRRIKSPVEYAVGLVAAFETLVPTLPLGDSLAELGQNLYFPPTTRGWMGGAHWINPATLLGRRNLAGRLLAKSGPLGGKLDPANLVRQYGGTGPQEQAELLVNLLLQDQLAPAVRMALIASVTNDSSGTADERWRRLTHELVTMPEFQLS